MRSDQCPLCPVAFLYFALQLLVYLGQGGSTLLNTLFKFIVSLFQRLC